MRFAGYGVRIAPALLLLTGCNSAGQNAYGEYFRVIREGVKNSFAAEGITRAQAAAIPYASMGTRLNGGPQMIIILATQTGHDAMWTSKAHIVLVTENGRIKHTVGLPQDMTITAQSGRDLTPPGAALQGPSSQTRLGDFPDLGVYNVVLMCRSQRAGLQPIIILGKTIQTTQVEEHCEAPSLDWSFVDKYWLDETGYVWRSSQHLHPGGETMETEIFRPTE